MKLSIEQLVKLGTTMSALQLERYPFWQLWRECADFILPKRYIWLQSDAERRVRNATNPNILDGTGTKCARVLAAGMMNGITSPARPWFTLRIPGFANTANSASRLWLDEVQRRMLMVMAETNFYNALAVMYLDLVVFGTAAMLIYEDDESVFRCYNPALGEFYLGNSDRLAVNVFAREFTYNVQQVVDWFGIENCSERVRTLHKQGGASLRSNVDVFHLIEPNNDGQGSIPKIFTYRETYWEKGVNTGEVLARRGYREIPGVFPRWELTANDAYGTSPGMDALGDIKQLQLETKRKAQGLDKMVSPPIVADIQLQHRPTATMPNGITYVAGVNNIGAKPLYTVNVPIGELSADIQDVRSRIGEIFHNPLFNMISQLDTVRSATEIDARKEEKLVLLGSVLERFQNEALDPGINRIFSIMNRMGMFPPPPEEIAGQPVEIQYVSILSTAQRAVAAIPTERWIGLIGNIAGVAPQALKIPNWDALIRNYGEAIGVEARDMNTPEQVAALNEQEAAKQAQEEGMMQMGAAIEGAQQLSETEVGGGANALQRILGG